MGILAATVSTPSVPSSFAMGFLVGVIVGVLAVVIIAHRK